MRAKIQKWGNSLGVRLNKEIVGKLYIYEGSEVNIEIENEFIKLTPITYQLSDFINKINENNLHQPLLEDELLGKEEW